MYIGKKDVLWNYAATFLKIASSALLLPFILNRMPSEMVGIWAIFSAITAFGSILDFGFNSTFTRNVTYIFSGVKNLITQGVESTNERNVIVDYGLLRGVISSMRWFYSRISAVLFTLLITFGTYYLNTLLKGYKGNPQEVYIAWIILIIINTYNLYTLYYDSLLQGKGLIKRSKQIIIIGQTVYLAIAAILIILGFGLIAIVSAQASSVIIIRWLAYKSFFTQELKHELQNAIPRSNKEVLKAVYPNAIKVGLTDFGSFLVQRSTILVGSIYLNLNEIASFGITMQLIYIIASLSTIFTATYQPKIAQLRVKQETGEIKNIYLRGQLVLILTYLVGGTSLLALGERALNYIGSQTQLIDIPIIIVALIISLLERNHGTAGSILLTNNEVPFFKASLIAGVNTIIFLLLLLNLSSMRIWPLVLAPGIAHLYNNWKWPYEVIKQLNISTKDIRNSVYKTFK